MRCCIIISILLTICLTSHVIGVENFNASPVGSAFLCPELFDIELRGEYAYCADMYGLSVWDLSDPENPVKIGQCETPGKSARLVLFGDYAYLSDMGMGVAIVDISDPRNPQYIRELLLDFYPVFRMAPPNIIIHNGLLFICAHRDGFYIANLEAPDNPEIIEHYEMRSRGISNLLFKNEIGYALDARHEDIILINFNDLNNIEIIDTVDVRSGLHEMTVRDDILATVADNAPRPALALYSIENPLNLELLGQDDVRNQIAVVLNNNYAYTMSELENFSHFQVCDISNPNEPEYLRSQLRHGGEAMMVQGDYIYTASNYQGVRVVSIENPDAPFLVNDPLPEYRINFVDVHGNLAYLHDKYFGLRIVDVSSPEEPEIIGECDYEMPPHATCRKLIKHGDYVYSLAADRFLMIDVSEPEHPSICGNIDFNYSESRFHIVDHYLYITDRLDDHSNICIFNLSEPDNPREVIRIRDVSGNYASIDGNYLYQKYYNRVGYSLAVYSIENLRRPELQGDWGVYSWGSFLAHNGIMYMHHHNGRIVVYSLEDPLEPEALDTLELEHHISDMCLDGNMIYMDADEYGFYCVSISDPEHPEMVGYYDTPGILEGLNAEDGYIYVGDTYEFGIYQFEGEIENDGITINLSEGWNLISSPFNPFERDIETIF